MPTEENVLAVRWVGKIPYREAWELQQKTWRDRADGHIPDTLLLLEHEPVFTMGTRDTSDNLLVDSTELTAPLEKTNRGGEMTYHGPGQLVGYFHKKLTPQTIGIKEFITALEEVFILFLRRNYQLGAFRDKQHRGVWVGEEHAPPEQWRKIVALGIAIKRMVTLHGFAFNISTALEPFRQIIPCGIVNRSITSLTQELEKQPSQMSDNFDLEQVGLKLIPLIKEIFQYHEVFYTSYN